MNDTKNTGDKTLSGHPEQDPDAQASGRAGHGAPELSHGHQDKAVVVEGESAALGPVASQRRPPRVTAARAPPSA